MVSAIPRFYCQLDKKSSWFLRQGVLNAIFHNGFWKNDHDFLLVVNGNFCPNSNGLEFINIFSLHGISLLAVKYGGFGGKWPPESENIEKHLAKGHFLESIRVFWAIVH